VKSRLKFTSISQRAKRVLYPSVIVAALCFLAFVGGSFYLGGDALNGYVRGGHYFVCSHGSCGEVTSAMWHYSYWHAIAALAGIFLVFVEVAILLNTGDIQWE
jgi:hypothetical protein